MSFYWGAKLDALPAGLVLDQQSYTTGVVATLSSDGRLVDVVVVQSCGLAALDEAVVEKRRRTRKRGEGAP